MLYLEWLCYKIVDVNLDNQYKINYCLGNCHFCQSLSSGYCYSFAPVKGRIRTRTHTLYRTRFRYPRQSTAGVFLRIWAVLSGLRVSGRYGPAYRRQGGELRPCEL